MKTKLTEKAEFLLREIAAGRCLVFYMTDRPIGWVHLERAGYVEPAPTEWTPSYRAVVTESGHHYLKNGPEVKAAPPHAANCTCPPCLLRHVRNGCRQINCKVCCG